MRYAWVLILGTGCAQLHNVQVGEMNVAARAERFEVKVDQTGFDLGEAAGAVAAGAAAAGSEGAAGAADTVAAIYALLTFGPKTGKMTFSDSYADAIAQRVVQRCPADRIGGLYVVRESADYPVVSGEVVKVVGYCNQSGVR